MCDGEFCFKWVIWLGSVHRLWRIEGSVGYLARVSQGLSTLESLEFLHLHRILGLPVFLIYWRHPTGIWLNRRWH